MTILSQKRKNKSMIELKRLNGTQFLLNPDLIEQVESTPDTVITLITGNNIVVLESLEEVSDKFLGHKRKVQEEKCVRMGVSIDKE